MFLMLIVSFSFPTKLRAEEIQPNDLHLRSAIVYNIAKYVTWPKAGENENKYFTIGVYGLSNSTREWSNLEGKFLHGKNIKVRRVVDIEELSTYQIIFIDSDDRKNILKILEAAREYPILTISTSNGFSTYGGMITLRVINNHMAFDVNLKSLRAAGLNISSNVLKLATEVIK